ncbi:hypothetical protein BDV97DRAFT_288983, partial [Delphinella strobiligena]
NTMPAASPVRAFMRSVRTSLLHDPHPYGRAPARLMAHKHDNLVLVRKLGRTAVVYFPYYAFVLGWPVSYSNQWTVLCLI